MQSGKIAVGAKFLKRHEELINTERMKESDAARRKEEEKMRRAELARQNEEHDRALWLMFQMSRLSPVPHRRHRARPNC